MPATVELWLITAQLLSDARVRHLPINRATPVERRTVRSKCGRFGFWLNAERVRLVRGSLPVCKECEKRVTKARDGERSDA